MIGQVKVLKKNKTDAHKNAMYYLERWEWLPISTPSPDSFRRTETEGGHCQGIGHGA